MSYFEMPSQLQSAITNSLGTDVAMGMAQNWALVSMGCMLLGLTVVISSMRSVYKSYRYNSERYRDGALLKFVAGVMLVNINWVIMAVVQLVN